VPALALTFDDGPDPEWTPRLLDALAARRAHATFFVIAPRAAEHPELVRRIADEGHAIALHCDEHVRHSARDAAWCAADTDRALARLAALGVRPRRWRTPWGDQAAWTQSLAAERDLLLTGWSTDTHDWRGDSADDMLAAIDDQIGDGAIVLAHDGLGPGARRSGCGETVKLVDLIALRAAALGLRLVALNGPAA
jgi:peptidoglycan-N-acetylglucosamine deacetylase